MAIKIYPTSAIRNNLSRVIQDVVREEQACYITHHGKAEAVLLSVERYNYLMDVLEDFLDEQDPSLARQVAQARKDYQQGKSIPLIPLSGKK